MQNKIFIHFKLIDYLAPEMLNKEGHSYSIDWYLLGVLMYELLVGFPPYYSESRK